MNRIGKYIPELVFTVLYIPLAVMLNIQFTTGSNINHLIAGHDEYIAVKEVYSILQPLSWKHFIMAVSCGDALYYGRLMFYSDALFAWLPFKIWGVTGMVISIRMTHALILLASLFIIANAFLKNRLHRSIFYLACLGLYYTLYFVMMPKPEPYQLLFLGLFLDRFRRSGWKFGNHFFLLGIAYGLKFNVLVLLPLIFILPLAIKQNGPGHKVLSVFKSAGLFVAGILVAVPCLILSPLKPAFLNAYLHETFGSSTKTYDNAALTITDWIGTGLGGNYTGLAPLGFLFLAISFWILIRHLTQIRKRDDHSVLVLVASGLLLMLVIMLKTKRLWPHYLWTGYILCVLGWLTDAAGAQMKRDRIVSGLAVALISVSSAYTFFARDLSIFTGMSKTDDIKNTKAWSLSAIQYLRKEFPGKRIGTDASILYPFEDFTAVKLYHPFQGKPPETKGIKFFWYGDAPHKIWTGNEAVVFYKRHPERLIRERSGTYKDLQDTLLSIYRMQLRDSFAFDTAFGEIRLYRRK